MISVSSAYAAAAAKPNKVPIFLFEIEGYTKGFSNADLGAFTPAPFLGGASGSVIQHAFRGNATGLGIFDTFVTLTNPVTAGDLILVMASYPSGDWPTGISDDAGNSYTSAYSHGIGSGGLATEVWFAVARANVATLTITETDAGFGGGLNMIVLDVFAPTFDYAGVSGGGPSLSATLSGVTYTVQGNGDLVVFQTPHPVLPGGTVAIGLLGGHWTALGSNSTIVDNNPFASALSLNPSTSVTATCYPWITEGGLEDLQVTVNDLDGGADLADLIVHVQDFGIDVASGVSGQITQDFPTFTFEGKQVHLRQGWGHFDLSLSPFPIPDISISDFAILFTGKLDSVESENSNLDYCFTCPDVRTELARVIYGTADDGYATSSNHKRTLDGHPLDILLSALQNEVGLDISEIDVTTIQAYRDQIYSGLPMHFDIDSPPVAKDFLENEICKPMGAYLRSNNLGQITMVFAYPLDITPVFHLQSSIPADPADNLIEIPQAGQTDLINQVSWRFDADTDNNFLSDSVEQSRTSIAKYGLYGGIAIESKGMRSGLNGFFLASITSFLIFLRYGAKALCHGDNGKNSASSPVNALWSAALLDPGDFITMSHPQVPDRVTGLMGIADKTYVVLDRTWQFFQGNVQYKLVEVDLSKFKPYLITTNGEASYTAASAGDKATLMFLCNDSDQYSNGDPANTLC